MKEGSEKKMGSIDGDIAMSRRGEIRAEVRYQGSIRTVFFFQCECACRNSQMRTAGIKIARI